MTANLTQYAQETILGLFRGAPVKGPGQMYVALLVESTVKLGEIVEVKARGYRRQSLTLGDPINGVCDNPTDILFGVAEANWGKVVTIGVYDALTGGHLWMQSDMERPQTVEAGSPFKIPVGELSISLV